MSSVIVCAFQEETPASMDIRSECEVFVTFGPQATELAYTFEWEERRVRKLTRFEKILIACSVSLGAILIIVLAVHAVPAAQDELALNASPTQHTSPTPEPTIDLNVEGVSLAGKRIIVDAGHGGSDAGCTGVDGRLEKEVNLEIAMRLKAALEAEGVEVIMTRETDDALAPTKQEDMDTRIRIIEQSNADAFISIHQNEYEGEDAESMSGPQVFYAYQGTKGKKLAVAIQDMLNGTLEVDSPRMALDVPYDVLKPGTQPSCTVECGFFSNPEEETRLQTPDYQEELARIITDGIKLYFKRTR